MTKLIGPKWSQRFLRLALSISEWSKDPKTRVGAVLVNTEKTVVATGFNGLPRRIEDDPNILSDRDLKNRLTIHAEMNAILNCRVPLDGLTMFVTNHPCHECAKMIVAAGIVAVHALNPTGEFEEKWKDSILQARDTLALGSVPLTLVSKDSIEELI